jgi:protein arginine kinase activator
MLCDNCRERDAVVHLTQIVESAVSQLHLCEKCAAEKGVETTVAMPKHPLGDFLQAVQQQSALAPAESLRCAYCSMTLREFRTTGRLGCAHCYQTFETNLRELLRRVHGNSRHVGRHYEAPREEVLDRTVMLVELRDRLRRAVESEQFELAADLRDRIRVLE